MKEQTWFNYILSQTWLTFLLVFLHHLQNTKITGDKAKTQEGASKVGCASSMACRLLTVACLEIKCCCLLAQGVRAGAWKGFFVALCRSQLGFGAFPWWRHPRSSCSRMSDNRKRRVEIHGGMWGLTWKTGSIHGGEGSKYQLKDLDY